MKSKSISKSSNNANTRNISLVVDNSSFELSLPVISLFTVASKLSNSRSISAKFGSSTFIRSICSSSGALNSVSFRLFFSAPAGCKIEIMLSSLVNSSELFISFVSAFEGTISPSHASKNSFTSVRCTLPSASSLLITRSTSSSNVTIRSSRISTGLSIVVLYTPLKFIT